MGIVSPLVTGKLLAVRFSPNQQLYMTFFLYVTVVTNMVNEELILCGESNKVEENLSIRFMHYVSYGGHLIQGRKP